MGKGVENYPTSSQRQRVGCSLMALALFGAALALANSPPQPQSSMHVADDAHQLSPAEIETIEGRFRDYEARHAVQLVLFTTNDASEQGLVLEKLARAKRDALKQSRGDAERLVFAANFNLRFELRNRSVGMAATRALDQRFFDAGNAMFRAENDWLLARHYWVRSVGNAELILGTADALMQVLDGKPMPVSPEIRAREADEARVDPIARFLFDHGNVFPVLMFTGFACAWLGAGIARPERRWSYGLFAFGLAMFIALPIGLVAGLALQALGIFITGYLWLFVLLTLSVWWTVRPQDLPRIRGLRR